MNDKIEQINELLNNLNEEERQIVLDSYTSQNDGSIGDYVSSDLLPEYIAEANEDMATEQTNEGCVFVNCYYTQSKWNEKNKKYQNYTAKLSKVNFKLENGKLALFKVRTGELIEDNISEAEILYNEEARKFIYTRKREGQRRLRIDFDENVFEAIRQGKTTKIKAKTTKDNKLHSTQRKTHKNGKKAVIIKFVKKMAAKIQNMATAIVISGLNV